MREGKGGDLEAQDPGPQSKAGDAGLLPGGGGREESSFLPPGELLPSAAPRSPLGPPRRLPPTCPLQSCLFRPTQQPPPSEAVFIPPPHELVSP